MHHLGINHVADGIQRGGKQRETNHIKDIFCIECNAIEKCLEIRYCDWLEEMMDRAEKLHIEYYGKVDEHDII